MTHEFKETLLTVNNVSKTLGGKPILSGVNIEVKNVVRPGVKQGQVVGLIGPSGVGKTTLFRLLAGLDEPDTGEILVEAAQTPVKRGMVGVVAQNYPLFEHRTVLGNLMVAGVGNGSERKTRAMSLLTRFGILEHSDKYPTQLSGGQRQRVAIAQQYMCSEKLLLMDEPFSGLDLMAQETVIHFIQEMALMDEEETFIIVTHDISAAIQACDTLWLIGRDRTEDGQIIPGAKIKHKFDLMERGLAWRPNITEMPEYTKVRQEIRELFHTL